MELDPLCPKRSFSAKSCGSNCQFSFSWAGDKSRASQSINAKAETLERTADI
jgi:hypothetical protein